MGQLTISKLNDVSTYRDTSTSILSADVMEVSLKVNAEKYVSAKINVDDLKNYIVGSIFSRPIYPHEMFDIFYRTVQETPTEYSVVNNELVLGSLYSAWPLFIDNSLINDLSINSSAPNWLNKASNALNNTSIRVQYPDFWNKLIELKNANKILAELVNVTNPATISSSQYMIEFNANRYTGRFLIDDTNGFVALPILNNSFIKSVASSGNSLGKLEKSGLLPLTGTFNVNDDVTLKNIKYCPYMQISNSYTEDSALDVSAALSGVVLNNRALTDLSNITTISLSSTPTSSSITAANGQVGKMFSCPDVVIESWYSEPDITTGNYSWYRKYKSGWVEQGGFNQTNYLIVTFPIKFANTNYTFNALPLLYSSNDRTRFGFYDKTINNIGVYFMQDYSWKGIGFMWEAKGMGA